MRSGRVLPPPLSIAGIAVLLLTTIVPAVAYPRPGSIQRVDLDSEGEGAHLPPLADSKPHYTSISRDGRLVAFESAADDLVPGDRNLVSDVFVYDRRSEELVRVSVSPNGADSVIPGDLPQLGRGSLRPWISGNGRFVAFESDASNLVDDDTNGALDVFVHDRATGKTERVSVATGGRQSDGDSWNASLSDDGRYVVFDSIAGNLIDDDQTEPTSADAYLHDRATGKTRLVSIGMDGKQLPTQTPETAPNVSGNGRLVAFQALRSDGAQAGLVHDVLVHEWKSGKTERISISSDGAAGDQQSHLSDSPSRAMSSNGRYVVFQSRATNLVPNDGNLLQSDIFVHDRRTGRTERVSLSSEGRVGEGDPLNEGANSVMPAISSDGRHVAFSSTALGLDDGYRNGYEGCDELGAVWTTCSPYRIFVHDRRTGTTEMVSRTGAGGDPRPPFPGCPTDDLAPGKPHLWEPAIDGGGRYVTFTGCGLVTDNRPTPLGTAHPSDQWHVYLRERGVPLGATAFRSGGVTVRPSPTAGKAATITARDLRGDAAAVFDIHSLKFAYRPRRSDLYTRIDVGSLPASRGGLVVGPAVVYGVRFVVDGVRYEMRTGTSAEPNRVTEASFGLFRCDGGCRFVAGVEGGVGTAGQAVVMAVPLRELGIGRDGHVKLVAAFSAAGTYPLDTISTPMKGAADVVRVSSS